MKKSMSAIVIDEFWTMVNNLSVGAQNVTRQSCSVQKQWALNYLFSDPLTNDPGAILYTIGQLRLATKSMPRRHWRLYSAGTKSCPTQ